MYCLERGHMYFRIKNIDSKTVIIRPLGEINIFNVKEFREELKKFIDNDYKNILLNLTFITYIDSAGLSSIIQIQNILKKKNGNLLLTNVRKEINHILKITHLATYMKIYATENKALNFLNK